MVPVVAIVGRPNVGKSTLFNALTGSRAALVADEPGLTRDRQYRITALAGHRVLLVDTGGLGDSEGVVARRIAEQSHHAIDEADLVLLLVDGRGGITTADADIATVLRTSGRPTLLLVNKTDGIDATLACADFHALGLGDPLAISAAHRQGLRTLADAATAYFGEPALERGSDQAEHVRVAIVGRPNVGKSTLVNRLIGEERVLAHDLPGTTRDSIEVPFRHRDRDYLLIDTAGIRRRARTHEKIEKFSIIKSLQAIEAGHLAVLVTDARTGLSDQDVHLAGHVLDQGRALVIAVNKWDGLDARSRTNQRVELERRLEFAWFAPVHCISALHGSGLGELLSAIRRVWDSASVHLPTPRLNQVLREAVERNPPPLARGRRIRLRYAHQGGSLPPLVVIHGNQTDQLPPHYRRYLSRCFREAFGLVGTPLQVQLRTGDNPFSGRRNVLTPRQQRHRQRLMKHVRR